MSKPIDILGHLFTPEGVKHFVDDPEESEVFKSIGRLESLRGYTVPEFKKYAAVVNANR